MLRLSRTMSSVITKPPKSSIKVVPHNQYDAQNSLSPTVVAASPLDQFKIWFNDAVNSVHEPEVMSLSTATSSGMPSARMVLFKELDTRGFVFYTNYTSRKSKELADNPHAALVFYWPEIHRSVRVLGKVEKVSKEESEEYFQSRPLGSRLGAWASKQSTVVQEDEVQDRLKKVQERFGVAEGDIQGNVPLPPFWGGWRVVPSEVEFWSGKPSRLHDRVRYLLREEESWQIDRLAP